MDYIVLIGSMHICYIISFIPTFAIITNQLNVQVNIDTNPMDPTIDGSEILLTS